MNAAKARSLCTAAEYALVRKSTPANIASLTPAQLRAARDRARKLRDKYRTLAARQKRESRGKAQPRGKRPSRSSDNTVRKVELFDEVLARFSSRLESSRGDRGGNSGGDRGGRKGGAGPRPGARKPAAGRTSKRSSVRRTAAKGSARAMSAAKGAKKKAGKKTRKRKALATKAEPVVAVVPVAGANAAPRDIFQYAGSAGPGMPPIATADVVKARDLSRVVRSKASRGQRLRNILAGTANARIGGHASGSSRRAQGRRDAKRRGEFEPGRYKP